MAAIVIATRRSCTREDPVEWLNAGGAERGMRGNGDACRCPAALVWEKWMTEVAIGGCAAPIGA